MRVALLDDDPEQVAGLVAALAAPFPNLGGRLSCASFMHGEALRRALRTETFDALVLDWGVPDLDGMSLLAWLRIERGDSTPVLMLSGRHSEHDVAAALARGADDYIVKPFRVLELRARIARLCERVGRKKDNMSPVCGGWRLERASCSAVATAPPQPGQAAPRVQLTEKEFRVALALFRNVGRAVSRGHLLVAAGYSEQEVFTRSLDVHVHRLRHKLDLGRGGRGLRLFTVYGQGYRLEAEAGEPPQASEPPAYYAGAAQTTHPAPGALACAAPQAAEP